MKVCECNSDIRNVLEIIHHYLEKVRREGKYDKKDDCIYSDKVYSEYSAIINSIRNNDVKSCFEQVICNEDYLIKIYSKKSFIFKHPDIILLKSKSFTFIVELKSYGKQNLMDVLDQLHSSIDHLPNQLRSECTAIIYMPESGSAIPEGYTYDPNTYKLQKKLGKNKKKNESFGSSIYAYVYIKGILRFM
ncbi:hypothetical protein [Sulfurisphaera ohwakuensis]|uniref:Uncharacterized protein n=1 Tax=Sulfurisphaera ohwakuensis TaxID=69656 RepID=A0A650CFH2_SULOH|nr:hypothetical protein [Sulfurisphaera ohwakuensis]MBB5254128.1 hypothetical protein [Sulfurisphaera ohwakuensis]QGR16509.1 hypothetical protein D1869_04325 [Sulfurisphaera ohwakuensis]